MSRNKQYPAELKEQAVRMGTEAVEGRETEWEAGAAGPMGHAARGGP